MIRLWRRHRTAARDACYRLTGAQRSEKGHRVVLGHRVSEVLSSSRTVFWVALTGAAWAVRIGRKDEEERNGAVTELLASALLVWRWRTLKEQLSAALRGQLPETPGGHQAP
jgi:hypothetical protein